jgi:hypothetical protein
MAATDPAPMSRAVAVLYAIGSPLTLVALVFVPAGRIDWLPGWVFIGVVTAVFAASAGVLGGSILRSIARAAAFNLAPRGGTWCWRKSS